MAGRTSIETNSFSQRQTAFFKATLRVMTEGFLKPNAKTAFFKAILKFCTAYKLLKFAETPYSYQRFEGIHRLTATEIEIQQSL